MKSMRNKARRYCNCIIMLCLYIYSGCQPTTVEDCMDLGCPKGMICVEGACVDDPAIKKVPPFEAISVSQKILTQSGGWDRGAKMTPSLLVHADTFRLWYTGFDIYPTGDANIGYSWSDDGQSWKVLSDPVVDEDVQIGGPVVIRDGDLYMMWYVNNFPCIGGCRYSLRVSQDGINWEDPAHVILPLKPWASPMAVPHSVIKENGIYKMWLTGNENPPNQDFNFPKIGYATSLDGLTWELLDAPVLENGPLGSHDYSIADWPTVVKYDRTYHMFYRGDQNKGTSPGDSFIMYAKSPDGTNWEKYPLNPVLSSVSWTSDDLHASSATIYRDKLYLVYSAYTGGTSAVTMGVTYRDLE